MKKLVPILIIIAVLFSVVPTTEVLAAQPPCQFKYKVQIEDTLRMVAKKYNLPPWDIIKANNRYMQKPNYPFYTDEILCIPKNSGINKIVSNSVLDQPAAEYYAKWSNGKLTVFTVGFAVGSNWWVKVNNVKVGKFKIINKNWREFTFNVKVKPTSIQLKNMLTDAVLVAKVK